MTTTMTTGPVVPMTTAQMAQLWNSWKPAARKAVLGPTVHWTPWASLTKQQQAQVWILGPLWPKH